MDAVKELFQINFSYILISVFIVLIGVRTIASPLEWLVNQLGLETKWMRKRREEHDLLKYIQKPDCIAGKTYRRYEKIR